MNKRIAIDENIGLYKETIESDGDCNIYFDTGESCLWSDENWPFATSTHFSKIIN